MQALRWLSPEMLQMLFGLLSDFPSEDLNLRFKLLALGWVQILSLAPDQHFSFSLLLFFSS
jgi:hypothetical protein